MSGLVHRKVTCHFMEVRDYALRFTTGTNSLVRQRVGELFLD